MARYVSTRPVWTKFAFDIRWLAAFTLRGFDRDPLPTVLPTAKDAAILLAMFGEWTSKPLGLFDAEGEYVAERLVQVEDMKKGAAVRMEFASTGLMKAAGFHSVEQLRKSLERLSASYVNGRAAIRRVVKCEDGAVVVDLDGRALVDAHPGTSRRSSSLTVDAKIVSAFSSRHSVPVYLHAAAWWHGWRSDDPRMFVRPAGGKVVAEMPADDVASKLGLDLERWVPAESGRMLAKVSVEVAQVGALDVRFHWLSAGPRHARLRVQVSALSGKNQAIEMRRLHIIENSKTETGQVIDIGKVDSTKRRRPAKVMPIPASSLNRNADPMEPVKETTAEPRYVTDPDDVDRARAAMADIVEDDAFEYDDESFEDNPWAH